MLIKSISISAALIILLVTIAALAEESAALSGNTELPPNGYIDFSGLPAPGNFPPGMRLAGMR